MKALPVRFDDCQFDGWMNARKPVSVRYMGLDRWESPGLSFNDYSSMQTQKQAQFHGRDQHAVPTFALNTSEMKLLLARYFECRAGWVCCPKVGPPEWRMKMAMRKIKKDIPAKFNRLHDLNREYVELTRQGGDPERLRELETCVQSLDGEILMAKRGLAPVVAVIYFHFRLGYNSCQTAAELGMRPQAVRRIAFNLAKLWNKMLCGQDKQPSKREIKNAQVREHRKNFTPEQREAFRKYHREYKAEAIKRGYGRPRLETPAYDCVLP